MLISPVPVSPVAPVQAARPSPVPVQGVASVPAPAAVDAVSEHLSRELDHALDTMDALRHQLAASQARLNAASQSVAQQARTTVPPAVDRSDTELASAGQRQRTQSALNQAAQARHSALSLTA